MISRHGFLMLTIATACGNSTGGDDTQAQNDGGKDVMTLPNDGASSKDSSPPNDTGTTTDSGGTDAGSYPLWSCLKAYAPTTRDGAVWPFSPSSPFNTPMGAGAMFESPTDPNTASFVLDWTSNAKYADIASTQWSQPVWIAQSTDPTVTLKRNGGGGTFATGVNCPSNAVAADPPINQGGDTNLNIIDPTHTFLDESWQATKNGTEWDANYWYKTMLNGDGINGGVRAGTTSTIGGLIRSGEFKTVIEHALGFAVDQTVQANSWVWPATSNDVCQKMPCQTNSLYTGALQLGQLMAIPPTVDICTLGLTPGGLAFARALQDFGAYVVDSSGGISFYAEPPIESDPTEGKMLSDAINDLNKIILPGNYIRAVTNNSSTNVGGGGAPRAPNAPAL